LVRLGWVHRYCRQYKEQSLAAAASSSLKPSRVTRSTTTASQAESVQKEAIYLSPQEYKRIKHGREVPPAAQLQYLKPQLLAQTLVHHKLVFTLLKRARNDPEDLQVMVTKANSITDFWYVECDIISPKHLRESALIQLPVVRGNTPSTDHKDNVRDLFNNIFKNPATLADMGISEQRKESEKSVDYVDNFSPTPGLVVARLMMSLAVANDMELHKIDIEQAFLQADKIDENVNGR
jgi:hypothetical protein